MVLGGLTSSGAPRWGAMKQIPNVSRMLGVKPELTASEARHRLALSEGQKENKKMRKKMKEE